MSEKNEQAQAKATELEIAAACKEIAEVSQAKRAAQPTETRPPAEQKAFEEGYADGYADCQAIRSPRAAAPVEPPPKLMMQEYKGDQPHEFSPDCRASGCKPVPASEPVEQAPRPQHEYSYNEAQLNANCSCGWRLQDCSDEFGRNQWNDHMLLGSRRAASSPVARPQTVETYDCDCDDLLCRDNRYCTSPAAARVEQPTPRSCGKPAGSLHPRLGLSYGCVLTEGHEGDHRPGGNCFAHGKYVGLQCPQWPKCAEEVYTKGKEILTAPAAPVVAQRPDFALIAAEKIFALFKNASYFSTRNSEHKQQMVEGWAEIIRSEAYSTPFSYRGYSNE